MLSCDTHTNKKYKFQPTGQASLVDVDHLHGKVEGEHVAVGIENLVDHALHAERVSREKDGGQNLHQLGL